MMIQKEYDPLYEPHMFADHRISETHDGSKMINEQVINQSTLNFPTYALKQAKLNIQQLLKAQVDFEMEETESNLNEEKYFSLKQKRQELLAKVFKQSFRGTL